MTGPLSKYRILDLSTIGMGPYATQIMGDLGADIIKIEEPGGGDMMRAQAQGRNPGMSPLFLTLNRNKRSLVLNLKSPRGREVLLRLIRDADALITNIRPGALSKLGVDYESVRHCNPRLVYCSLVGFGSKGRYAGRPAFDDIIQGVSGLAGLHARTHGSPQLVPAWIADQTVGLVAVHTVLAALLEREATGLGQHVEVPMFESMVQFVMTPHLCAHTLQPPTHPAGYKRLFERRVHATSDGHICGGPYTRDQWHRFFDIAGRPDMAASGRYDTQLDIAGHIDELYDAFAEALSRGSTAEWLDKLLAADIAAMPIHTLESIQDDPHLKDEGFFVDSRHPTEGLIRTMNVPTDWSRSVPEHRRHAPSLGEHSEEILKELGYAPDDIQALFDCGASHAHRGSPGAGNDL
ncbi:CoA transferase [Pigmentiphaga sp. GD03639]|uniref:CaiB/BaiF CoA transferase family protein n=1 Tax=unclassified Pigmentiphaga TaxID=2626614 RepID=UPI000B4226CA|nr:MULTISPECIES: CoA transferase [unclassified Pigmentiphaga]MDH2239459.1 CoA transferase [Pigmentiphaga sp. GD03639]OVZ60470.1 hypothetical protein CDO46_21680 [Pigmentiphaga sp. NML030171]